MNVRSAAISLSRSSSTHPQYGRGSTAGQYPNPLARNRTAKRQGADPDVVRPARRKTARVTNSGRHIRLIVDIDPTSDPIQGMLSHGDGPEQPFVGWTPFVRAVEIALDIGRRRLDTPPDQPTRGKP